MPALKRQRWGRARRKEGAAWGGRRGARHNAGAPRGGIKREERAGGEERARDRETEEVCLCVKGRPKQRFRWGKHASRQAQGMRNNLSGERGGRRTGAQNQSETFASWHAKRERKTGQMAANREERIRGGPPRPLVFFWVEGRKLWAQAFVLLLCRPSGKIASEGAAFGEKAECESVWGLRARRVRARARACVCVQDGGGIAKKGGGVGCGVGGDHKKRYRTHGARE
jgi:hypothetical protein